MQVRHVTSQLNGLRSQPGGWTVRAIFEHNNNWDVYAFDHWDELRPVEIKEVEKMMTCKDHHGFFVMKCEKCNETHHVYFGCNSRICSNCGKNYTDKWAKSLKRAMFDVPHRHIVLSVASELWPVIEENRKLLKVLMDSAIKTVNNVLSHKRRLELKAGAIVVLHSFSRDLSFKPHIHILLTEGGFDKKGNFHRVVYFPAEAMRKVWQYEVLTNLKKHLPETRYYSLFIDKLFKNHPKGFYVYLPAKTRIRNRREVSRYVGRYVRHPAIANGRIVNYDGMNVTFWFKDNQDIKHTVTMGVHKFIQAIIRHIPDKQFKMIRYYGAYARRFKRRYSHYLSQGSISQTNLEDFHKGRSIRCPKCGSWMVLLEYTKEGPPDKVPFGNNLDDWNLIISQRQLYQRC